MAEDWRENRQDERIERLEDELREAKQKIWALEMRPWEWLWKAEMAVLWLSIGAMLVAEIAAKN